MMKGRWIEDFGFKVGRKYNVDCQNAKLIIYIAENVRHCIEKVQQENRELTQVKKNELAP